LIWYCGVRRSVVLSSLARCSILLRGLVLYGTVLSCPARLCKARLFEVWRGMSQWGPVLLGQVRFGSAKQGAVLSGGVKFGLVLSCRARRSAVLLGKVLRGIAWLREALFRVVKFCPVKHCYVSYAKALSWFGEVLFCAVGIGGALHAEVLLRFGMVAYRTVESGLALLRVAGQALVLLRLDAAGCGFLRFCRVLFCWVSLRSGVGKQGSIMRGAATCSKAW